MTYHPSNQRKPGRPIRVGRSEIMAQPVFSDMLRKVLDGNKLDDISPNQLRNLVTRNMVSPEGARKWEDYAEYRPDPKNPKNDFRCTICNYHAKRQLIIRHINGTHLRIK